MALLVLCALIETAIMVTWADGTYARQELVHYDQLVQTEHELHMTLVAGSLVSMLS